MNPRVLIFSSLAFLLAPVAAFAPHGIVPLVVAAAVFSLADKRVRQGLLTKNQPVFLWLLVLAILWALITAAWTYEPMRALRLAGSLTALLAAARTLAAAAGLLESEERNVLAKYFLLAGAALAALLLFENATNGPITRLFHDFPGKMDDHMPSLNPGAAILAVLAWPLVMAAARWRGWRWGILVLAVVAVAVFMARTKTPIIALFLSVLLFPVLAAGGRKAVRVFGALAAGFLIAAPFIYRFLLFPVAAQGEAQAKIIRSMPTLEQRTWIWRFVVERIEQHPFLGWGLDASRFIEGGHEPMKGYDGRMFPESLPLHPHNGFLQIWLELGGVGAVLIAVALAALLFAIGKTSGNAKMAAAFFAMAVTYLVIGQVSFGVWQNWWLATAILSTSLCLMMSTSDGKKR